MSHSAPQETSESLEQAGQPLLCSQGCGFFSCVPTLPASLVLGALISYRQSAEVSHCRTPGQQLGLHLAPGRVWRVAHVPCQPSSRQAAGLEHPLTLQRG